MKTKTDIRQVKDTGELIKAVKSLGYIQGKNNGGHLVFRKPNSPTLSIPEHKTLSPGTKRNILKVLLGDKYYV